MSHEGAVAAVVDGNGVYYWAYSYNKFNLWIDYFLNKIEAFKQLFKAFLCFSQDKQKEELRLPF